MKYSLRLSLFFLCMLGFPLLAQAQTVTQQSPFSGTSSNVYSAPAGNVEPLRPQGNVSANQQGPGYQGLPNHPYPQQNNPFYDGSTPGGMVSDTIDWIVAFPSNLMDRVSEYLDTRFFPSTPATSGVQGAQPGNSNPAPAPLPPANAYKPGGR